MPDRTVSAAEFARSLGLSPARIVQLKGEGLPFTVTPSGHRFQLGAATRWYVEHVSRRRKTVPGDVANVAAVDSSRARKAAADAQTAELRAAREAGTVVAICDVASVVAAHIAACRARLLAIPSRCSPLVAAEDSPGACLAILESAIHDALAELSDGGFAETSSSVQ